MFIIKTIFKRVLVSVPILIGTTFVCCIILRIGPLDPVRTYLSSSNLRTTQENIDLFTTKLGLDKSIFTQYFEWLRQIFSGHFGNSFYTDTPIIDELIARVPVTLLLVIIAIMIAITVSIPLGTYSALKNGGTFDKLFRFFTFLGAVMPQFLFAYLLIIIFSIHLKILPFQGNGSIIHFVLPSVTLSLAIITMYSRIIRTSVLEAFQAPYVEFAYIRGIPERTIIMHHVLPRALRPVITAIGINIGKLFAGTVLVEQIFGLPGVGQYFIEALIHRDYPVIQAIIFISALVVLFGNLLSDIILAIMSPDIMHEEEEK
ncbi:ABC transporter permease [Heyndrickxia sp. NPDC080065]|uniref:ABC transporter permease n=1 Tax=Heyndrickxia sp. NPDC080065 TaxID=3390568 RepID=UPI003CFEEE74